MELIKLQYELIRSSREVVFQYCKKMNPSEICMEIESFGNGSIRNTLVHIANVYESWIGQFALKSSDPYSKPEDISDIQEILYCFQRIDSLVDIFLREHGENLNHRISGKLSWRSEEFYPTALELITHVMTHEFHHKGQIMTMGRMLGHTPPDTDIIRFL
ncbi:DinB family protein [Paenibacillus piri]|uniref:Damage-inducible protein DinB n=1 Tax=Paenibacillus piri TaxID=2547395 RepID=A0A4R5K8T4_9BACL|nr:DinB family protein [Paenibacillus piri]TDF90590.1 damage-inducible protein DinB [Paenibacillus piri]